MKPRTPTTIPMIRPMLGPELEVAGAVELVVGGVGVGLGLGEGEGEGGGGGAPGGTGAGGVGLGDGEGVPEYKGKIPWTVNETCAMSFSELIWIHK
jgi:hypothetical protein